MLMGIFFWRIWNIEIFVFKQQGRMKLVKNQDDNFHRPCFCGLQHPVFLGLELWLQKWVFLGLELWLQRWLLIIHNIVEHYFPIFHFGGLQQDSEDAVDILRERRCGCNSSVE
jgi:hypothetical protein